MTIHELITEITAISGTTPPAGATTEALAAAETRLQRPLNPEHREFLAAADGWPAFNGSLDVLSAEELGQGPVWDMLEDIYRELFAVSPVLDPGGVTTPDQLITFAYAPASSDYVVTRPGPDRTVYILPGTTTYASLTKYLRTEIAVHRGHLP